jgi:hypothetical protein
MKTFTLFLALFLTSISINAQQSVEGLWNSGQDNTQIEIISTTGKIYSSDNDKATVGKLIIKELKKTENTYKGKLHLIRRNRWVDAVFVRNGNYLNVTISAGWQSKTLKWQLEKNINTHNKKQTNN